MITTTDLDSCAREPIHAPGAIQAHGYLIATDKDYRVTHYSNNIDALTGRLLTVGEPLTDVIGTSALAPFKSFFKKGTGEKYFFLEIVINGTALPCIGHAIERGFILEIGLQSLTSNDQRATFQNLSRVLATISSAPSLNMLLQTITQTLRSFLAIDRVMIYRFDDDWNGEVIAESKTDTLPPYLGLHYPASDIPAQARALYTRNWLRTIPDVNYHPIPITPACGANSPAPLDLSDSILRSISPLHIQYLKNMGVAATIVMSLMVDDKLWGLVACHHYTPHILPLEVRYMAEMLAKIISNAIQNNLQQQLHEAIRNRTKVLEEINLNILKKWSLSKAFLQADHNTILSLVPCDGAAVVENQRVATLGVVPGDEDIFALARWLDSQQHDLFVTHQLSAQAGAPLSGFAGVMAVKLGKAPADYVFWFRQERIASIAWGGNPEKQMERDANTNALSPRNSFETFKQEVKGKSLPWTADEVHVARQLKSYILEFFAFEKIRLETLVAEKTNQLAKSLQMVEEAKVLAEQNSALKNHMLAAMSHEIRTPLNGIMGMAHLIKLKSFDAEIGTYVNLILQSGQRLSKTLTSVLELAEIEAHKRKLKPERCDLAAILHEVVQVLTPLASSKKITLALKVDDPDLWVQGDSTLISQIFYNLVENAVKYTAQGSVDVEALERVLTQESFVCVRVRDTGIGISQEYIQKIFEPFTQESMGMSRAYEGVGLGLSLTKRYVDLSGGFITVESEKGRGSSFEVMLPKAF